MMKRINRETAEGLYDLWLYFNKPHSRAFNALAYMYGFPDIDYSYIIKKYLSQGKLPFTKYKI